MPFPIPFYAICAGVAVSTVLYVHREEISEFFEDLAVEVLEKIERRKNRRMIARSQDIGDSTTMAESRSTVRKRRVKDWIDEQEYYEDSDTESIETPSRTASSV
ncbi:hypothetical protein OGAPHI_002522 [Ogataea philodendri]|uniref:Uncharacterized protein n=1 Tax=Ogataea philodendri TaxID=1378263 RepID=A0A9P8PBF0_9ASCO|nr:uncharacterized protein OGAPHI_002522 [Ogataea philodendri]KAH3668767.1 hypothetical protein OGAPHI_002522 [Ogataea philodendri]